MKHRILSAFLAAVVSFGATAETFVNLTPKPKQMTVGTGELTLPQSFTVGHSLSGDMQAEVSKFIATFTAATGLTVSEGSEGLITVSENPVLAAEGYTLDITAEGVTIAASAPAGLYYAFRSLMKIMPPNVILGIASDAAVIQTYTLPLVSINDEPRYPWRGLEIDVARHFFDVAQIKKMIDIMAVYKMNRLHWHLTDDQGWRFEMPKYPKLTTAAGAPKNQYWWDFDNHMSFLTNKQYGPYFYTVEEMKEVVAYAKEHHIEVCPEVDMPGHMQCAIAAYPEFSTTPDSDHPVRYWPGVSTDILDISNPAVMQFLRDVIDQLAEIFPYEYIHIGGDECPTTAWANSASCQEFKKEYGLQSDRAIQNWMTKELADHASKDNRKLICWNEVITTDGADHELAQDADILIYCWLNPGGDNNPSKLAASLGLRSVWCPTSYYYLDYPQWGGSDEPHSMGGVINLERTYNGTPDYEESKKEFYYGVNCNLWTEFICENKHLEYNALPRMIAVAETGWTPTAGKDFSDFKKRFNADTRMLDAGNYTYGRHYVDQPADDAFKPEEGKFYRLITQASADAQRRDRCIELIHSGCSLISDKGAAEGQLWSNAQAAKDSEHYDWQYWTFEADPAGSGKYAMVNRKAPEGSVSPAMSGSSIDARWSYDNATKHYNFVLGEHFSTADLGGILSIRSDKGATWFVNCAQAAQNLTINNWADPEDGNGGMWLFHLEDYEPVAAGGIPFEPLKSGNYAFVNSVGNGTLSMTGDLLTTETDPRFGAIGWTLTAGAYDEKTDSQTVTLQNMATGLYIGGLSQQAVSTIEFADGWGVFDGNAGHTVTFTANAAEAAELKLARISENTESYTLSLNGKQLFAFGPESTVSPNGVNARAKAPEMQGSGWFIKAIARAVKASATDGTESVGTYYHYDLEGVEAANPLPQPYELYEYVGESTVGTDAGHDAVSVELRRVRREVFYRLTDTEGRLWEVARDTIDVAAPFIPAAPSRRYLTFKEQGAVVADTATVIYTTEAIPGIGKLGAPVTAVEANGIYAIEDTHSVRHAFRGDCDGIVGGSRNAEGCSPAYLWKLETKDAGYNVRNMASGRYVQEIELSTPAQTGTNARTYNFTFNKADETWKIKSTGNGYCWDGLEDLHMVGWYDPGHSHKLYTLDEAAPYYQITVTEKSELDKVLSERTILVCAGDSYIFAATSRPGKTLVSVEGNEELDEIYSNKHIIVTYALEQDGIDSLPASDAASFTQIHDLQGRRLNSVGHPGIYIVNGRKILTH